MKHKIFSKNRKPMESYEVGGGAFRVEFYSDDKDLRNNYLLITTPSRKFEFRTSGYPMGYLLATARQGKMRELEAYCVLVYRVSEEIYQDSGLANDIIRVFGKRDKRLLKQSETDAGNVSETDEMAAELLMHDAIERARTDGKESRREIREVLRDERADS